MKHYRDLTGLKWANAGVEFVICMISYFLAGGIRFYLGGGIIRPFAMSDVTNFLPFAIGCGLLDVIIYAFCGDYSTVRVRSIRRELLRVIVVQIVGGFFAAACLFLARGSQFSRVMLCIFIVISIVFLVLKRMIFSYISLLWCRKNHGLSKVLIVGNGKNARRFYRGIDKVNNRECSYVGHLAECEDEFIKSYLGNYDSIDDVIERTGVDEVIICSELEDTTLNRILVSCALKGVMVYIVPSYNDYLSGGRIISTYGDLNMVGVNALNIDNILGVNIAVTSMEKTIQDISEKLNEWRGKYICVSNVHTTVMAHENPDYMKIQNGAVMALPDGSPLSSYSRENGRSMAKRVTGPDLMREILLRSGEYGWKHFFYGSTEETLKQLSSKLKTNYPDAEVVGMISPPFRELTKEEETKYLKQINESGADFLWVGLGAPKQEIWMANHEGMVNSLMIGVGAAFAFESGTVKRAPKWVQNLKLEWFYRMLQDPKRLFKRYFVTNIKYLWLTRK